MLTYFYGATLDTFQRFSASGKAHMIITNDSSTNDLEFSENGSSVSGHILPNEGLDFHNVNLESIFVKSKIAGNSCPFRVWFYGELPETESMTKVDGAVLPIAFEKIRKHF